MGRKRIILVAILILLLIVGSIIYFVIKPDIKEIEEEKEPFPLPPIEEKTLEEVIKDLTAPTVNEIPEVPEIPEAILEDLTAPR